MGKFGFWIANFLFIATIASSLKLVNAKGTRAIILYTYDDTISGSEVLSMEINNSQFAEVIMTSKYFSTAAEPMKFDSGYFALLEGKDTSFKLQRFEDEITCQCKALKKPTTTTKKITTTTTTTPRPTTTTTVRVTQPKTSTPAPTYLPPTEKPCSNGGRGKYCCVNGADNPDCCENGGSGTFCCLNGAKNPDCCANGGSGPNCCTANDSNPKCRSAPPPPPPPADPTKTTKIVTTKPPPVIPTTTPRPVITTTTRRIIPTTVFKGPSYLPIAKLTTTVNPYSSRVYTWGTVPTSTYKYSWTHGTGTWIPYSRAYTLGSTTTTPRYNRRDDAGNELRFFKK